MSQTIPRPEYPRPQMVRDRWLNLNGPWSFCFDDADEGFAGHWWERGEFPLSILVPFPYQCELSGINDKGIHPVVWYSREFEVPPEWSGEDVVLHFGAVDYRTTVWVNGQEVGHNTGGHVPFSFDVGPYLKEGANRVTLRVQDDQDPKQPRGKQSSTGLPHGIDYYCTTGIWQTVWLEPVPVLRIHTLRITPVDDTDALDVTALLHAPGTGWTVEVTVLDGDHVAAEAAHHCTGAVAQLRIHVPGARRWSPATPHLYDLVVRMRKGGRVLDEVRSYAGIRSVAIRDGRFTLNGEPVYLAMVLDQGYWPQSYLAAPTDEALREDVEWIRRFGYNGVRKHQKIEDPRWYYWCDRLGLMVWGEMPNARAWSPSAEEALVAEWERAVARDQNHPCIVTWVPVNESMGFPDIKQDHAGQYDYLERLVVVTRRLDATRPVIDNDGWEHTDITDIVAVHDYSHSAQALRERYAETLAGGPFPARTWTGSRAIYARGARHHGQPIMLTEVGGFLDLPDLPPDQLDRMYKIYAAVRSGDELLERYRDLMEGIRELTFVHGFCYTQLTDIEQELNGLLTYDRRPKLPPEEIAAIHRNVFGV